MLKRMIYALTGLVATAAVAAMGAGIPLLPSSPTYSEPSQIQATINAVIQMLNGNGTYATAPAIISLGTQCQGTAGASPVTCNGQRGFVPFTGITVAATGTNQTLTITNSSIAANSLCHVQPTTAFTAGSAVTVATVVPAAGSLAVVLVNAGTTTNAVTTGTLGFTCFN